MCCAACADPEKEDPGPEPLINESCFEPENVSEPNTKAMLAALVPLFAKYKLQSEQAK
jgi:hypothetical protein